ncbi:hypothetical protein NUW58_g5928 [Xylaria curta]|uniref:Uncharacterized protein n=1 Tax=Xylaria curta TaxID=42375 RepID=A0ACC1NZS5_9PEZI|nr:hypothetical protein NUW58_g5928 [Xylaria curta]
MSPANALALEDRVERLYNDLYRFAIANNRTHELNNYLTAATNTVISQNDTDQYKAASVLLEILRLVMVMEIPFTGSGSVPFANAFEQPFGTVLLDSRQDNEPRFDKEVIQILCSDDHLEPISLLRYLSVPQAMACRFRVLMPGHMSGLFISSYRAGLELLLGCHLTILQDPLRVEVGPTLLGDPKDMSDEILDQRIEIIMILEEYVTESNKTGETEDPIKWITRKTLPESSELDTASDGTLTGWADDPFSSIFERGVSKSWRLLAI